MSYEAHQELFDAMRQAEARLSELAPAGRKLAEAEREYRIAKRAAVLYERAKGTPATLVADVVKGREDIAQLAFARDCAEAEYRATLEAELWAKKKVDTLREVIAREWGGER